MTRMFRLKIVSEWKPDLKQMVENFIFVFDVMWLQNNQYAWFLGPHPIPGWQCVLAERNHFDSF